VSLHRVVYGLINHLAYWGRRLWKTTTSRKGHRGGVFSQFSERKQATSRREVGSSLTLQSPKGDNPQSRKLESYQGEDTTNKKKPPPPPPHQKTPPHPKTGPPPRPPKNPSARTPLEWFSVYIPAQKVGETGEGVTYPLYMRNKRTRTILSPYIEFTSFGWKHEKNKNYCERKLDSGKPSHFVT